VANGDAENEREYCELGQPAKAVVGQQSSQASLAGLDCPFCDLGLRQSRHQEILLRNAICSIYLFIA
jgi:hypothetical protein